MPGVGSNGGQLLSLSVPLRYEASFSPRLPFSSLSLFFFFSSSSSSSSSSFLVDRSNFFLHFLICLHARIFGEFQEIFSNIYLCLDGKLGNWITRPVNIPVKRTCK